MVGMIFAAEKARSRAVSAIAKAAKVDPRLVYLDVPTTPSVPYTYSKETLTSVGVLKAKGARKVVTAVPLEKLPLVGSIAGYMDMLRVYTTPENRSAVERATSQLLGGQSFMTGMAE